MRKNLILLFFFLLIVPGLIVGQSNFKIKGRVTDAKTGEPLIGANVMLKPLNLGASTDLDGNYSFDVPASQAKGQEAELTASFINYKKKTVTFVLDGKDITRNFALTEDIFQNEEIVVTGIASKTSKSVAEVSVARVAASELSTINTYGSLSQLVGGKVAGVQLTTSSGNIGSGWRFFVRGGGGLNGDGQPTIYIDGTRVDNSEQNAYGVGGQGISMLANLNPNDIDKIEFLKGPAAAASYGTNGSNGVVVITTKSGQLAAGVAQGLKIDYKFNYGYNQQLFKYKSSDFITANDANRQFQTGPVRENVLSATGGGSFLKYYASFENRNEVGIMPGNSGNRTSARVNLTSVPISNVSLRLNTNYINNTLYRPNNDNIIYGFLGNTLLRPTSFGWVGEQDLRTFSDKNQINQFIGSASVNYRPIENLEVNGGIGMDNSDYTETRLFPYGINFGGLIRQGQRAIYNRNNRQFTYDFNANYSYTLFGLITAKSTAGGQFFNRTLRTSNVTGEQFSSDLIVSMGAAGVITAYGESFLDERQGGLFTEHSFNYMEQYFLTLGIRRDYASSIGKQAPVITYPKASAAVRLDKFGILPEELNLLKVRVAYGESGILPGTTDPIPLLWTAQTGGYGAGAVLANIGNSAIQPERVKELELGLDAEIMRNTSVEFTYYWQNAVNSIVGMNLAPSTGKTASSVPFNIGSSKAWGFESLIQYSPIRSADYSLSLSLIWNYQNNRVLNLGGAQPIYDGFNVNVIKEGLPRSEYYALISTGAKYDANGKYIGSIASTDRVDLGNPIPNSTGSFTINFKFLKNFTFYTFAEFALRFKIFNDTKLFSSRFGNNPTYNLYRAQLGLPAAAPGVAPNVNPLTPGTPEYKAVAEKYAKLDYAYSGNYIEDADYLTIREVTLSYDFTDILRDFELITYIKYFSAGFTVRNLARFTKYSGPDVEINSNGSRALSRGLDFLTLQTPRTVNFWVRIGL